MLMARVGEPLALDFESSAPSAQERTPDHQVSWQAAL